MKLLSKSLLFGIAFGSVQLVQTTTALAAGYTLDSFRPSPMVKETEVYFGGVINLAFVVAMALVFFYLILGAIGWITSSGDAGKLQTAKNRMIQAVIGLFVLVCVWALYTFIMTIVGGENWGDITFPVLNS